jgi:osmotically-inducible protein OsmY
MEVEIVSPTLLADMVEAPRSESVAQAAKARLCQNPYSPVQRVTCECRAGILILRGRVPTYYHKQIAQEAVSGLEGVEQVVNETEVVRPAS